VAAITFDQSGGVLAARLAGGRVAQPRPAAAADLINRA
jgi:hypothetical protein